jgi:3-methylfumaryl-CoA hydratase
MFITVRHEIHAGATLALIEEQDLVFCERLAAARPLPSRAAEQSNGADAPVSSRRAVALGPVELFRFSALTFNGHRIHYDRDYACREEGYPGLVVHGPYIALLLADQFLRSTGTSIARVNYRARSPLFEGERFELCVQAGATAARLWALGPKGEQAMQAEIEPQSAGT